MPLEIFILDAWGWCTGMTQLDGVGREEGGGFRMWSTCIPVADSFWCLAKLIQCLRIKNKIKKKIKKKKYSFYPMLLVGGWEITKNFRASEYSDVPAKGNAFRSWALSIFISLGTRKSLASKEIFLALETQFPKLLISEKPRGIFCWESFL